MLRFDKKRTSAALEKRKIKILILYDKKYDLEVDLCTLKGLLKKTGLPS